MQHTEQPQWYIALVANNTELATKQWLEQRGQEWPAEGPSEYYLPLLKEDRTNRRGKVEAREKPAIPRFLFVRATNRIRYNLSRTPNIKRWVMSLNYAPDGTRQPATVSDQSMRAFQDFVNRTNGYYRLEDIDATIGHRVRFVGGPLKGLEGTIEEKQGSGYVFKKTFDCEFLGTATTVISRDTAERYLEILD